MLFNRKSVGSVKQNVFFPDSVGFLCDTIVDTEDQTHFLQSFIQSITPVCFVFFGGGGVQEKKVDLLFHRDKKKQ